MKTADAVLLFTASAAAFPGLMPKEQLAQMMKREAAPAAEPKPRPEPQLSGVIGSLTNTISGLLGSVATSIDPSNKRPEKGFDFIAPTSSASRGPCPGLNLLANHGYLPRDGKVTLGQVVAATNRGFNMGTDLSTILAVFAVLTDGDIATESFYLGAPPSGVGGLNRHSTVEVDISVNREDYYNGCGDNHHLSSRLFKQNVDIVAKSTSKQFDLYNMGSQYEKNSKFSQANNPYLYYFPFPMIVSLGAFPFYPQFMSNGTFGAGGVANYESISSIIGAKWDKDANEFTYVPERFPEAGWYRRATPYGAVQTLVEGLAYIYTRNPVVPAVAQVGTPNLNATTFLCNVYQGINSIVPLFVSGSAEQVAAATTWAISKLDPYFKNTVLGCPTSAISPNFPLYSGPSNKGGPLNPPASVSGKTGNNVYNKVYFKTAPTSPQC